MGSKNVNLKQRRASHFSVFVCQNWMKNGKVMTNDHAKRTCQSGAGLFWAKRWPFWPHFLRCVLQTCLVYHLDEY